MERRARQILRPLASLGNYDETKFKTLSFSTNNNNNTAKVEFRTQRRLLQLNKYNLLPRVYEMIRPTGSLRPRMFGLPKTHKKGIPLWPILSMTGSSQHQLAKWICSILQPVLTPYSTHCIQDSFTFAERTKTSTLKTSSVFFYSFDTASLFLEMFL